MNTHAGHAPRGEISAHWASMKSRLHSVKPLNLFGEISRQCRSVRWLGTQGVRNSKPAIAGNKGGIENPAHRAEILHDTPRISPYPDYRSSTA